MSWFLLFLLANLFAAGCGSNNLTLKDWRDLPDEQYTIPPFASHLADYKIALDPGHGGNAHLPGYKRGPTGKREAVMNLNVALLLKEFLERTGASVVLTRQDERFVALAERAKIAEKAGCDFMISLHHNASRNPRTNYSAVFYHLTPDYSPFSMDLARNIYFGLVEALRLPQVMDKGLLTDTLIYPAGFGLLRRSKIPAILLESSFYSNPAEEKRLTNLRYNRREAYGIFMGLARWAAGGIPGAEKISPGDTTASKQPTITYRLFDGLEKSRPDKAGGIKIFSQSVSARLDGRAIAVDVSGDNSTARLRPDSTLSNGVHLVQVSLENMFKNHNLPRVDTLIVAAPVDSIHFDVVTPYVPADPQARIPVTVSLYDADSEPVWDSTEVTLSASKGSVFPTHSRLKHGRASFYFRSEAEMGLATLTAEANSHGDTLFLSLAPEGHSWILSGTVHDDSTGQPLSGVEISLTDSIRTTTDGNGFYFFLNPPLVSDKVAARRDGFAGMTLPFAADSLKSQIVDFHLAANLGGLLHGEDVILDAALGGAKQGHVFPNGISAAAANLTLVKLLADTLRWAGARPILIRNGDETLSPKERIRTVNQIPEGWYLKIGYEKTATDSMVVQTTIYPANEVGEEIATALLAAFKTVPHVRTIHLQNTRVPEVTLTNKTAVELLLKKKRLGNIQEDLDRIFSAIVQFQRRVARTQN